MTTSTKVLVRCQIERGGFGNERTFRVQSNGGEHVGLAPWIYCFDKNKEPVEAEPEAGQVINGFIVARIVSITGATAKVVFPDGEVCAFDVTNLIEDEETVNRVLV
jgi:hypothetical protein